MEGLQLGLDAGVLLVAKELVTKNGSTLPACSTGLCRAVEFEKEDMCPTTDAEEYGSVGNKKTVADVQLELAIPYKPLRGKLE